MTFHAFIHSRSGVTSPVYAASFSAKTPTDARNKALANPGVKKVFGAQQTHDLVLMVHEADTLALAKQIASTAKVPT